VSSGCLQDLVVRLSKTTIEHHLTANSSAPFSVSGHRSNLCHAGGERLLAQVGADAQNRDSGKEEVLLAGSRQVFVRNNATARANPLDTTGCCGVCGQRDCLAEYLRVGIVAILNCYDVVDDGY